MAAVDVGDVIEVILNGRFQATDEMVNVFQAEMVTVPLGTAAETITWVSEWTIAGMTALVSQVSVLYTIPTIDVFNLTQQTFLGQFTTTLGGADAGEALPPQVTALVMARTTTLRVEGRKYLPVFGEAQQVAGRWTAGAQAAMTAFGAVWVDPFIDTAGTIGQGVIVTKLGGVMTASHNILATRIIIDARTQRRRTVGRGS